MEMTKEKKKSKWKIIAGIILLLQLLASGVLVGVVIWLNLLPTMYVVLAGLVLFWLLTIVYYLYYSGMKKKRKKKTVLYVKRTIGSILAACVLTVCIWGSVMITETKGTIDDITDNVVTTDTVSAYVMKDDPAETVEDAKDYIFAITEKYDAVLRDK